MIFHANLANIVQTVGKSFPSNPVFSCQLSTETLRGCTARASLHAFHRFSISPILRGGMSEIPLCRTAYTAVYHSLSPMRGFVFYL